MRGVDGAHRASLETLLQQLYGLLEVKKLSGTQRRGGKPSFITLAGPEVLGTPNSEPRLGDIWFFYSAVCRSKATKAEQRWLMLHTEFAVQHIQWFQLRKGKQTFVKTGYSEVIIYTIGTELPGTTTGKGNCS